MWIWILVETYLAIMCACGPALKPLYTKYIASTIHSAYDYGRSKQSPYTTNKSNRSAARQSYASKKGFANVSHQSSRSISRITGNRGEDGEGDGGLDLGGKGMEMSIVVRSDIEQVEERTSDESMGGGLAVPMGGTWEVGHDRWAGRAV